ncbi:Mechanosensitive ion channel [Heterobasidion irregulare TC 32-1]|uniref:Mechanosensitive ion channel n=1 Tax=Heterobasidion irregulare (strain TC 32-1) TaxID=747525 RepID=W4KGP0_HETIT|nr:Mechanosensitive ion channel [Heterobasidion irregulare TC 32-1]ETW84480.1 Mechanosensitive ion channel [Heterobasidion irregulare TC 32-1]
MAGHDQRSRSRLGPAHLRLFDTDDLPSPLPSPPYKSVASTSQLALHQTPPYRSRVDLMDNDRDHDHDHDHGRVPEKPPVVLDSPRPVSAALPLAPGTATPKPTVHYTDDLAPGYSAAPSPQPFPPFSHSRQASLAGTDDEYDEDDEYDWSAEEDLVDEEAKFEHQMGIAQRPRAWGFKRVVTLLFGSLIGSTFLAALLVAGPVLVHFFWYKPHPTDHRRYVLDNLQAWLFWAAANLLVSWWLALIIDLVPAVVRGVVALVWGHVSESIKTRIELFNSVKGTVKPLFYAASGWVSWVILFEHIYNLHDSGEEAQSRAKYTNTLDNVVEFLFFLTLVWCAQKMLSHAIAFAFHRTAFKERIDALRESLQVIEHLRNYRPKTPKHAHAHTASGTRTPVFASFGFGTPAGEKGGFEWGVRRASTPRAGTPEPLSGMSALGGAVHTDSDWDADEEEGADGMGKGKSKGKGKGKAKDKGKGKGKKAKRGSAGFGYDVDADADADVSANPHRYPPTPMPDGAGAARRSSEEDGGAAVVAQAARVLKNAVLHDARNLEGKEGGAGGLVWDVTSAHEAKRLARLIYTTFKDRRRRYLLPSDLQPAYKTPSDAARAFRVFDADDNGDLSRAEIKTTLLKVYKERRFLSRSMRDVGAALRTLDLILLFFAAAVLFFVSLSVFDVSVGESLTSVYSIGIAASFIFKNAASNAFDAIMFLFVTHPFDTGDRCFIDEENLVVKKMGLFATVFARSDGTETYYFNSQLFNKFITNVRRSDKTFENLTMQVAWRTPLAKLDALERCLNEWLAREENRWFMPSTSVTLQKIDFQRHLEITIGIGHNGTWQDWGLRQARKTAFHAATQYYCRQLGIVAFEAALPVAWAHDRDGERGVLARADEDGDSQHSPRSPRAASFADAPPSPSSSSSTHARGDHHQPHAAAAPADGMGATSAGAVAAAGGTHNWLGFAPPAHAHAGGAVLVSDMRARKSMSRKAAMRGFGLDG